MGRGGSSWLPCSLLMGTKARIRLLQSKGTQRCGHQQLRTPPWDQATHRALGASSPHCSEQGGAGWNHALPPSPQLLGMRFTLGCSTVALWKATGLLAEKQPAGRAPGLGCCRNTSWLQPHPCAPTAQSSWSGEGVGLARLLGELPAALSPPGKRGQGLSAHYQH